MVLLFKGVSGVVVWVFPARPLEVIKLLSFSHQKHFCTLSSIHPVRSLLFSRGDRPRPKVGVPGAGTRTPRGLPRLRTLTHTLSLLRPRRSKGVGGRARLRTLKVEHFQETLSFAGAGQRQLQSPRITSPASPSQALWDSRKATCLQSAQALGEMHVSQARPGRMGWGEGDSKFQGAHLRWRWKIRFWQA